MVHAARLPHYLCVHQQRVDQAPVQLLQVVDGGHDRQNRNEREGGNAGGEREPYPSTPKQRRAEHEVGLHDAKQTTSGQEKIVSKVGTWQTD